jgi:cell fate regulator YaaT (PSP1 superfamily)
VPQQTQAPETGAQDNEQQIIVGVRFQPVGKIYHFDAASYTNLRKGDFVIVTTSRGRQLGQVASVGPIESKNRQTLKPVERLATGRDLAIRKRWESKEREALETARKLNAEVGLAIKLIKAEYSFDGKLLTILYSAEDHKETKPLRQRLSRAFRARVELRQIGPRDVAKIMSGYGACGGPRCCSTFLAKFSPISIRMAKAQSVSLSPSEITGMCGRLRCCLVYEYEQYVQARKELPKQGKQVGTPYGEGKVISLMPLKNAALIDLGERRIEIQSEEIIPLEEWRSLQKQAAKADESQDKPRDRVEPATSARQPKPKTQARRTKSGPRHSTGRRARPKRKDTESKKPAQADEKQDKPKTKPSRRRRRR